MTEELHEGDKVSWQTSRGKTEGKVVEKITEPTSVKGHTAKASKEHPEYKVQSAKTGKTAIHKPDALTKE